MNHSSQSSECRRCVSSIKSYIIVTRLFIPNPLSSLIEECDGGSLYDSAELLEPQGPIGKYQKTHQFYEEKLWFTPGDLGYPVFETE